jgi:hypothetical protein
MRQGVWQYSHVVAVASLATCSEALQVGQRIEMALMKLLGPRVASERRDRQVVEGRVALPVVDGERIVALALQRHLVLVGQKRRLEIIEEPAQRSP